MTYTEVWDGIDNAPSKTTVQRDADRKFIPFYDPDPDYQEYKAWLAAGNHPTPAEPPGPTLEDRVDGALDEADVRITEVDAKFAEHEARIDALESSMRTLLGK